MTTIAYEARIGSSAPIVVELDGDPTISQIAAEAAKKLGIIISTEGQQILRVAPGEGHQLVSDASDRAEPASKATYVVNERATNA